ncbi:MAG TPA: hypothetical protein VFJ93_07660 [Gaiellaceae bacterium]|nr:hypothetical protein [Gaiellaceae bacterium]
MALNQDATITLSLVAKDMASGNIQKVATGLSGLQKSGGLAGTALKGAGVLASAGFGAMALGALGAQKAAGDFAAQTGETQSQAKQFVTEMDNLAGTAGAVGKSFEEVADVGVSVEKQFGTTGQATQDLTGYVLDFAKASHQDAKTAAEGLGDTLAAFGVSSDKASGYMDELIASTHQFGTDIGPEAIQSLQDMAPALQALGGNLDDGIALLNAFEGSSLDAKTATKDLTAVIKTFPPGTTLNDVITKMGAIHDDTQRANTIMDTFGPKLGPALAKIIQPGMTSLDDFKVSMDDAKGATKDAADGMLTDSDKIHAAMDKLVAGAREVGQDFGPALTGLASLGSLVAPFAKEGKDLLIKVGERLLPQAAAAGAAEGEAQAAGATGSGILNSFLTKFGLMTPAKIAAAAAAGTAEGIAEGEAAAEAATGPEMAAKAAGLGPALSAAALPGAAIAGGAIGAVVVDQIGQKLEQGLSQGRTDIGKLLADPQQAQSIKDQLGPWEGWLNLTGQAMQTVPILGGSMVQMGKDIQGLTGDVDAAAASADNMGIAFHHQAQEVLPSAIQAIGTGLGHDHGWELAGTTAAQTTVASFVSAADDARESHALGEVAHVWAQETATAYARGLYQSDGDVESAFASFTDAMKHPQTVQVQLAELNGELTSKALKKGLESGDPLIRQQAEDMRDQIQQRINDLQTLLHEDGVDAGQGLDSGLNSQKGSLYSTADEIVTHFEKVFGRRYRVQVDLASGSLGGINPATGRPWGHAIGGFIPAGTVSEVGENGPELLVMGGGGAQIMSNGSYTRAGREMHFHLHLDSVVPASPSQAQAAARAFIPELTREMRRQGILPSTGRSN